MAKMRFIEVAKEKKEIRALALHLIQWIPAYAGMTMNFRKCYLPPFKYFASQSNTLRCHWIEFFGFNTQ